jgi:hypothetical protein
MGGMVVTAVLFFGIRAGARGTPSTMNREYQEATDAYLKVRASTKSDKAVQQPNKYTYRRTTSSPSPVSLPRTTRVASPSRVLPRPRSKRPFQSKGPITVFMRESQPGRVTTTTRRRSLIIDWTKRRLLVQHFLERPLFRSNDEEKIPCTSFFYLCQRTCTKITFIPFVFTLITPFRF